MLISKNNMEFFSYKMFDIFDEGETNVKLIKKNSEH